MRPKFFPILSFLVLIGSIYLTRKSQLPQYQKDINTPLTEFSTDRALERLKIISEKPHFVGTKAHTEVRNYLVSELEKMGLTVEIQAQEAINPKWKGATLTYNILSRIKGSDPEAPALVLMSHYDSSPHSSLGASDAGSGVVAIVESVRAYLASGEKSKNDLIILITDAEELGLLGAEAFVRHHPWAKDVKLVLNLEARGSGGPSYMLLETNGGNEHFIKSFSQAKLPHPVGNSLLYSIYKMLPNDTDLTVFREVGDIDGFNFAFIDDHFDYHSVQDSYERVDKNSLKQQGEYMFHLMKFYGNANLTQLKSEKDYVFFNMPFIGMMSYPFAQAKGLFWGAVLIFFVIFYFGLKRKRLELGQSLSGFIPLVKTLVFAGLVGFFGWKLILKLFPAHQDILHGFTYNGKWYVLAFVALSIWVFFKFYNPYLKKKMLPNLLFAPLFIWLVINGLIAYKLQGASFFIIPNIGLLLSYALLVFLPKVTPKHAWWFLLFAIPGVLILSPFVEMFPVGLGLKMLMVSMILGVLIFTTWLPVFEYYNNRKAMQRLFGLLSVLAFFSAFFNKGYDLEKRAPNSLIFVQDLDKNEAYWASYDRELDDYTSQVLTSQVTQDNPGISFGSKYKTDLKWFEQTETKKLQQPVIQVVKIDSLSEFSRYDYVLKSSRKANAFYIKSQDSLRIKSITFNGEPFPLPKGKQELVWGKNETVLSYYLAQGVDSLHMEVSLDKAYDKPRFDLYEISTDLPDNPLFSLQPRTEEMMPKPFIVNDAIILKKQF
jgi:hypothetical protein